MNANASLTSLEAARAQTRKKRLATLPLFIIGLLLIALSVGALFSLSGKAVRYDQAFDQGKDLSDYFFAPLAEGESYSAFQSL
ncbi:MAG: hypothetical protein J6A48_04090, partial [Clostridia bacterium]|nr:hypothetical protein [Clostridia bacterium]